jgi:tetratricopeptide (TPR) repeat protein
MKVIQKNLSEIIIFLLSLSVYISTSARVIIQGDSGDFLATAATGGIPHPSGYPLYSFLARIAYLLPFGNPTWQVNIESCFFASVTLVVLYKIVKKITRSQPASLFSVLALGTFESFWFYALTAQVHILQVMLLSLIFYFLISFLESKNSRYINYAAVAFGLGASNNLTIVLILPACIAVLYFVRKNLSVHKFFIVILFALLGLVPYLYIFYAAAQNSPVSWGGVHDFWSFFRLITRADYGSLDWVQPEAWAPFIYSTAIFYWKYLFQTSWFILPFTLASVFYFRKNKLIYSLILGTFILLGPLFYLLMNLSIRNVVYQANSTPYSSYSYLFFSILSGIGLHVILSKYKLHNPLLLQALIILFFIPIFFINLPKVRLDNNNLAAITTRFQLSEFPKNAIVITSGDSLTLPGRYWQYAQKYRPDVTIIDGGLLYFSWYRENLEHFHPAIAANFTTASINFDNVCKQYGRTNRLFISPWYPDFDVFFQKNCIVIPYGLAAEVISKNSKINISAIKQFNDKEWQKYTSLDQPELFRNDYLRTREQLFYLGEQKNYLGIFYLRYGKKEWALKEFETARSISPDEVNSIIGESALLYMKGDYYQGISILELAIKENPADSELYKNLAIFYEKVQNSQKAYENFKKYLSFNPTNDNDVPNIVNYVNTYESNQSAQGIGQ